MRNTKSTAPLLALAALVIAGCAATPSVTEERVNFDVSRYSEVQVRVDSDQGVRQQPGYDITATDLLRSFVDSLRATGKFAVVGTEGAAPGSKGLDVRLRITGFNYVSGASRGLIGIAAGRAVLNVSMEVTDIETKEAVGVISAGHASHHGQGVFSPTTGRQAEAIGKELAMKLASASKR
jgi:hypothetical protein